ncbi:MAG: phosphatase PAP2 family protein [Eubacteriales bacterium]|nr:phosphatase PAP2 family protein [Eubacteriales bacterium]
MAWEFTVLDFLQTLHGPVQDTFFKTVTHLGDAGIFFILLGFLLLFSRKTREYGIAILSALVMGALLCNVILKPLVARARPCWINEAVQMLVAVPKDYSFPSGHSQAAFATASAVFVRNRRAGIALGILAVLIAFSRLYLYVHFPTDVLVGTAIGICMGALSVYPTRWITQRLEKNRRK